VQSDLDVFRNIGGKMKVSLVKGNENVRLIHFEEQNEEDRIILKELNDEGLLTTGGVVSSSGQWVHGDIFITGKRDSKSTVMFLERELRYYYPEREAIMS